MNIKRLKEVISELPDDMVVILGSYYRNNPDKLNLHAVACVSDAYCKDNDPYTDAATYSEEEYQELKQEKYEKYKTDFDPDNEDGPLKSIEDFWVEYLEDGEHGFSEYDGKCFVMFPSLEW